MDKLTVDERLELIKASGYPLAWDGCHKIYFLDSYEAVLDVLHYEYALYPSSSVKDLWDKSCPLRFISRWGMDNGDFDHAWNIEQGELYKQDDED